MESWSYVSQEKGFICDEINSPTNSLIRNKSSLLPWESTINNVGFPEMIGKELPDNSISDVMSSKNAVTTYGTNFDPIQSYNPGEDESTSKLSCLVVDSSNSRDSLSLIDLKLGRFGDHRKDAQILSSESSTPLKKVRCLGVYSKTVFCQVYGCNKDLSSSKDYHKRHKVCEVHSKTAKVIVKGTEQRFCQQCSRFHLLAEFDDGKRSCRKRLAGHNERRRKPHVLIHSGRTGRLLRSSNGGIFQGTTVSKSSFICQELLSSAIWNDDCYKHIKVEDNNDNYKSLSDIPTNNGTNPLTVPCNMETQFPPFHYNGASSASTENMFHHFNASSNFQVLHGIPDSIPALSLLSSQSQNSSNHSMACQHNNMAQVLEQKLMEGVVESSQEGLSGGGVLNNNTNNNNYQFVFTAEGANLGNNNDVINFQQLADGILDLENDVKDCVSYETHQTIDLLQLSSPLQRVEHHRQSMLIKEENQAFAFVRIT